MVLRNSLLLLYGVSLTHFAMPHGITTFQCQNGYFLSRLSSVFDGSERIYKFSCSKFPEEHTVIDETCSVSEVASTKNGDIFLSCNNDQYTVGIEIIDNIENHFSSWQLLCCFSESITVRDDDCIDTKFINDIKRSSTFSTGTQIIRRWQAIYERGDYRWWIQICPIDFKQSIIDSELDDDDTMRMRRQVPPDWSRGRFPPMALNSIFLEQEYFKRLKKQRISGKKKLRVYPTINKVLDVNEMQHTNEHTELTDMNEENSLRRREDSNAEARSETTMQRTSSAEASEDLNDVGLPVLTENWSASTTVTKDEDLAVDYYDAYDEHFDRKQYESRNGILSGVSDILQSLRDGLTLAQATLPNKRKLVIRTDTAQDVAFSTDDNSLSIGIRPSVRTKNIDSAHKLRHDPDEKKPTDRQTTSAQLKIDVNSIQQMLQFLGLCKGHGI